jgi:hypothetical protein
MVALRYIESKVKNTSSTTNKRLAVGPISITNDTGFSINYIRDLQNTVKEGLSGLKSFKSYIY